jgi:hypothetical protein
MRGRIRQIVHIAGEKMGKFVATWTEVKKFIYQNNYQVNNDSNNLLTLELAGDGRSQLVFVSAFNQFLLIASPFAKVGDIPPGKALTTGSCFGSVQLGDIYALRHVALLDTLDAAEINLAINELAGEADRIEAELTGGDTF